MRSPADTVAAAAMAAAAAAMPAVVAAAAGGGGISPLGKWACANYLLGGHRYRTTICIAQFRIHNDC